MGSRNRFWEFQERGWCWETVIDSGVEMWLGTEGVLIA